MQEAAVLLQAEPTGQIVGGVPEQCCVAEGSLFLVSLPAFAKNIDHGNTILTSDDRIRLRQQLVEMTAAMSRLTELAFPNVQMTYPDSTDLEEREEHTSSPDQIQSSSGQQLVKTQTMQGTVSLWFAPQQKEIISQTFTSILKPAASHKYIFNATVVVENVGKSGGEWFSYVGADLKERGPPAAPGKTAARYRLRRRSGFFRVLNQSWVQVARRLDSYSRRRMASSGGHWRCRAHPRVRN